jgi:cytochrome b6-f complex iron-sulfur subunit
MVTEQRPPEGTRDNKDEKKEVSPTNLPPIRSSNAVGGGKQATSPARTASKPVAQSQSVTPPRQMPEESAPVAAPPKPSPVAQATAEPVPTRVLEPRRAKQDKPPDDDQGIWRMSRKSFLNVAGWMGFFGFLATATVGAIRLMVPRVIYEPPSAFKAGFPDDYIIGEVNERYKDEFRVWIVREREGFYALAAICTHLGCTPRWAPTENKFKCPCHGSGYYKNGINFEGPTPRPLERLKISLTDDGQILVDRNIKFLYEKQEWSKPEAYLKYT